MVASIEWLLVWGRFYVAETIIPEAQEHFLTPSARRHTHLFGGLGLQRRIAELEGQAKPDDPPRMPGLKAKSARKPPAQQQPRKQRRHGFARPRMTPTHRVEHVVERCPDCGAHLSGGWTQRTREVIELPVVPVQVTEQVYIARTCPACRRRCTPPAVLDGVVLGQQRFGVNLLSLIATLREEGRLPIRSVQW